MKPSSPEIDPKPAKLTGPEMLLKNLLGIDPKQMQETVIALIGKVNEIHAFMADISGRLDRLEHHLGIADNTKGRIAAVSDETESKEESRHATG